MQAVPFEAGRSAAAVHAALRKSVDAADRAQRCAVQWFGEIMRRKLYRDLGYSSIHQYAQNGLGFSRTRTGDFVRLSTRLQALPEIEAAVARGEIGYTKAREIVKVATPETEQRWLAAAAGPRRGLEREVAKVRRVAQAAPGQGELLAEAPPIAPPESLPVRFAVDLTPEQEARREALWERLRKLGGVPAQRGEVLLEALAALVESRDEEKSGAREGVRPAGAPAGTAPRVPRGGPPFQVHVHLCPRCSVRSVNTAGGEKPLSAADVGRAECDARVAQLGGPNTATIPPRRRRAVLARDRHRCRAPGCGRTRFLEVHHITPRQQGGGNDEDNLITLCAACHRLWHERRGRPALRPSVQRE